jgi:hypothetical protein
METEENSLNKKINEILVDIYNKKLLEETDDIKNKIEQFKIESKEFPYEKHLKILKIFIDKIYENTKKYREKILDCEIIKEIKKIFDKDIKNINNNNNININNNFITNNINYFSNVSIKKNKEISFDKIKDGLKLFLYDLEAIKTTFIDSSSKIKEIFQNSLKNLTEKDGKLKNFDINLIHLQVFNEIILSDEFIQLFLIKIKKEFKNEFGNQISRIQENPYKKIDEMSKFKNFVLEEINNINNIKNNENDFFESKINLEHIKNIKTSENKEYFITTIEKKNNNNNNNNSNNNNNNNDNNDNNNDNNNNNNNKNNNNNNKNNNYLDINELLVFINDDTNEKNKAEKGKKKKNKKRKKNNDNNNSNNNNNNYYNDYNDDKEKINEFNNKEEKFIDDIKQLMKKESCHKKNIRKIKPTISKDWLKNNN